MKQRDAHEVLTKPLNTASMIIARGASAVARRESRSHSMLRSPSHSLFSGGVTSQGVWSHTAPRRGCLVPGARVPPCAGGGPSAKRPRAKREGGRNRRGLVGHSTVCPQFPRCNHAKSCVEAQRRAERDASCRIEYDSGQSRGSRDLSGSTPIACGEGELLSRLPRKVHGAVYRVSYPM